MLRCVNQTMHYIVTRTFVELSILFTHVLTPPKLAGALFRQVNAALAAPVNKTAFSINLVTIFPTQIHANFACVLLQGVNIVRISYVTYLSATTWCTATVGSDTGLRVTKYISIL